MNSDLQHANVYTAIDLFSGCGGLSLGLHKAGFSIIAAAEIDLVAARTYEQNHPGTPVLQEDVRNISAGELKKLGKLGNKTLDLLAGCPPCQGFSRIKRKNKKNYNDPRNDLVSDFLRLALEFRPRMVLLENVPALAQDDRFKKMVKSLRGAGYKCKWKILNAADFGVPQRRKRLILMASRLGKIELPKPPVRLKSVRDAIGKLEHPNGSRDELHTLYLRNSPKIKARISKIPKNGGSRKSLGARRQLKCHQKFEGFRDVYGRMSWDEVAPTLTGGCFNPSKGRFLHPRQNRAISMREAALLQSFPKYYKFPVDRGLTHVARLIGDALPPKFAELQGKHVLRHLMDSS